VDSQGTYRPYPQQGRERLILAAPVGRVGTGSPNPETELFARLNENAVFMMGDNPALPQMPDRPGLLDFYRLRFEEVTVRHLLGSAKAALDAGHEEKIVLACLLHDISNGCFVRSDHGYWGAQMIAPYVDEEIAWAVQYHQALRYIPDPEVGYAYPASYDRFFGPDFKIPDYLARDAEIARKHRWYMSSRLVTMFDTYFFDQQTAIVDPAIFTDMIGRHFHTPKEGLGFDGSPVAHMWRTMIWPNNFL
jgi:hypothetical protein